MRVKLYAGLAAAALVLGLAGVASAQTAKPKRPLVAVTDFDYELQMAQMNKQMKATIETVFLFANPKLFFSASRLIKEVAGYGKRLPELVPEAVMNRLRAKLKVD